MTVGNSTGKTLYSICGSLLVELPEIANGRFNTLLKCFANLTNISSLSVRSVLPSALSIWMLSETALETIYSFQCIVALLRVYDVCKRLDFFCILDQPRVRYGLSVRLI